MLDQGPSTHVSCNREEGLDFYKKMQIVRRMEASANNMYKSKLIRGFCHLYSGQVIPIFLIKDLSSILFVINRKLFALE